MQIFANNASSTLSAGIADTDTSVVLVDATSFPDPGANFFLVTLDDGTNVEIIKCTTKATNTLTVVRAQEGTTARAWLAGAKAEMRLTAGSMDGKANSDAVVSSINTLTGALSLKTINSASLLGSGDVVLVDLATAQTLSNKTVTGYTKASDANSWTGEQTFKELKETVYTISGTTPSIDPANGTIQIWTLTGNSTPTSALADGQSVTLLIADGTAYTITWTSVLAAGYWVNGAAPTLATAGYNIITLMRTGGVVRGMFVGATTL